MFGYILSFLILMFILVFVVWLEVFPTDQMYAITLICVALVSVGATVQQSSFYGLTGMLPARYTQAVMTGESMAGLLVSLNRILTKSLIQSKKSSTVLFFIISIVIIVTCIYTYIKVQSTELIQFYRNLCKKQKLVLKPCEEEDASSTDYKSMKNDGQVETQVLIDDAEYYQIPEFSSSCRESTNRVKYRVEDVLVGARGGGKKIGGSAKKCVAGLTYGLYRRMYVCKKIWPYMLGILLSYMVTLSLFPGIESEIQSCSLGDWMPVILMATFNITDLVGKMLSGLDHSWSCGELVLWPLSRLLLIPLLVMCAAPHHAPLFTGEWLPISFTVLLGLSNGLFGSLPIILAPSKVRETERELTGNLMTFSYCSGLTLGALMSYWLDGMVGSHALPCFPVYTVPSYGHRFSPQTNWPDFSSSFSQVNNLINETTIL